ncbi:hypothetical protein [Oceaniglobus trochenteri]|uniref:hypothetical protein n=1 Tax=Oceaniglobus trochenteri TaxID=2763260 RepID=UPI001CFFE2C1|nr:hypothetical protein [Oceaniglobus trochenteri]
MIVLETRISNVHRNRDFGMVEARVTLLAKTRTGHPPHLISVHAHVPARGKAPLRDRLVADGKMIAGHLSRLPGQETGIIAA